MEFLLLKKKKNQGKKLNSENSGDPVKYILSYRSDLYYIKLFYLYKMYRNA